MWVEIYVGIILGVLFFGLGIFMSRKVDKIIYHKAELEQKYKNSQCQRIIEILKDIEDRENKVKDTLKTYQVGSPTNRPSDVFMEIMVDNFKNKISKMNNAIGQLRGKLNDTSLGDEFSEYLGWFNFLPARIEIDRIPQQARQQYEIDGVISGIDKQLERIKEFIGKFTQEIESNSAEKREEDQSVAHEVIDRSKYPNAPKLNKLVR